MARSLEAVSVDKLEGFLVCSICLETLKDPRTLPCFHSYCESCLERFVKNHRDKAVGRRLKEFNCPTCRSQFILNPGEEVADMMTNHFVSNMLDVVAVQDRVQGVPCSLCQGSSVSRCITCEKFLCQKCLKDHSNFLGNKDHCVLSMFELSKPENQKKIRGKLYCKKHGDRKALKFYCETCEELICRYCMDFNHVKANHSCLPVENVADKEKNLLASQCNNLEVKLKRGKEAFKEISDVKQSLEKMKEQVRRDIIWRKEDMLNAVVLQLNEKVERLIGEVERIYSAKHNTLAKQQEEVKRYVDKLESCVNLSTGLLENGTNEEILLSTKMIKENMQKVETESPKNLKPAAAADKMYLKYDTAMILEISEIKDKFGMLENSTSITINLIENAFQQMNLDEEPPATHVAQFILQVYKADLISFKRQHSVDVVFSQDQKKLTLKPMHGFDWSQKNELESTFQKFYESTSKKLKEVTIDLREFGTLEDIEKIKESMSRQGKQSEVMIEESSDRDVFTLVGDADNMKMFRRNLIGALRKNSPVSKETLSAESIVASRKGIQVILMQGDIEKQECDAIVNFTDKDLVHKTGIPCAIKEEAGMSFWSECRDIIANNGSLLSNMVIITTAGSLPCKQVIHAILPDFTTERSQEVLCHNLQETCRLALDKAKEKKMKSISFPVVTPNIVNQVVSPHLLFNAIIEFTKENNPLNNNNTIEEIRIVYRENSKLVEEYANEFSKNF